MATDLDQDSTYHTDRWIAAPSYDLRRERPGKPVTLETDLVDDLVAALNAESIAVIILGPAALGALLAALVWWVRRR